MKNRVLYFVGLFFVTLVFTSCSSVYIPNNTLPKDFNGRNEVYGSVFVGGTGVNLNFAYSPINHVYIHGALWKQAKTSLFKDNISDSYQYGIGFFARNSSIYFETEIGINNGVFDVSKNIHFQQSSYKGVYENMFGSMLISTPVSEKVSVGLNVKAGLNTFNFSKFQNLNNDFVDIKYKDEFQLEAGMFFKYKVNDMISIFNYNGFYSSGLYTSSSPLQVRLGLCLNFNRSEIKEEDEK